jgi:mxaK protein
MLRTSRFSPKYWRSPALWIALAAALALTTSAVAQLLNAGRANKTIAALVAHQDVQVDPRMAPPEEVLARVNELIWRERIEDAQALLNSTETTLPTDVRVAVLYNVANARTRQGAETAQKGDLDGAAALVNLAKSEYRLALKLRPADWDMKYNLDVAMRVVRDLPLANNPTDKTLKTPKQMWYEIPGLPKGLP